MKLRRWRADGYRLKWRFVQSATPNSGNRRAARSEIWRHETSGIWIHESLIKSSVTHWCRTNVPWIHGDVLALKNSSEQLGLEKINPNIFFTSIARQQPLRPVKS
jgi:hypothetical protein